MAGLHEGVSVWVRFIEPYDYRLPSSTVAYKPGDYNVPQRCATLAVLAGRAVRLRKDNKNEEPQPWQEPAVANSIVA